MKHLRISFLLCSLAFISFNTTFRAFAADTLPVESTFHRLLGNHSRFFVCQLIPKSGDKEVFELESKDGKIILRGSSQPAIGYALNWYITRYCHGQLSRAGEQLTLPKTLPIISQKIRKESPYEYRYFYNYCTYNYTMSFWDWNRWEKEIDWLVLHGVNMPLTVIGTEAVWQNTLKHFGLSNDAIGKFIPGPAYTAWWLMGNLEGWGGPVSQAWIDHQAALQQKIVGRMRELGMTPVFQGFYGMVPDTLRTLFPNSKIYYGGIWAGKKGFRRPAYLDPSDTLFAAMAKVFYHEQEKLYGKTGYYGGDPFHEGGNTKGIDITHSATLIQQAMQKAHPGSIWALQGWWENPTDTLLAGVDKAHTLILDLFAEGNPQWERRKGYHDIPWAWCCLLNFGGKIGMFSRLDQLANESTRALKSEYGKHLKGIGMMMEGDETNPINFELLFDAAWRDKPVDVSQWVNDFTVSRYGAKDDAAQKAWQIIYKTALSCPHAQEGTSESIFCARGDTNLTGAWTWGNLKLYYSPEELQKALSLLLSCSEKAKHTDTYQYDVVDLSRQVLANYGQIVYKEMITAYKKKDLLVFRQKSAKFLQMIDDQDKLLATRKEFLLGRWIESAKNVAPTIEDKALFERNAKTLITIWGTKGVSEDLHEYANREWSGMLSSLYKPRWEAFVKVLAENLSGNPSSLPDYYSMEDAWIKQHTIFPTQPSGDAVQVAKALFIKYFGTN